jgi:tetratricopeptide (TPR) repeat protein
MNALGVTSPFASSPHRDVLETPVPMDGVSRLVLLNELKNRARPAVSAGQYPDAIALYEKALHVVSDDPKELSVLEANLSLCHQKMAHWSGAVDTALRSTAHDPSYVKGWWRLGQAHAGSSNYGQAILAMQKACQLEPENKAIRKELEKFQNLQISSPTATTASPASTSAAARSPTSSAAPKPKVAAFASSKAKTEDEQDNEDDGEFSKSDVLRGYKVVNGKKTSYFHNELSKDAAMLIGDIAPKRLDPSSAGSTTAAGALLSSPSPSALETSDAGIGTSAWNKAGTWEERDVTKWALDSIRDGIEACRHQWDAFQASVIKCDASGHASVAMVRGKKRYIYELELDVEWHVNRNSLADDDSSAAGTTTAPLASGKLSFPEVDGTCSGVYEASVSVTSALPPLDRGEVDRHVCKKGLRDEIHGAINAWIELLKETY